MAEMILPGVYIQERAEGLIVPGRVTVGTLGVVGTASKGKIFEPVLLGSYAQAREEFAAYDEWNNGKSNELTLLRALELSYIAGASSVFAVRVAKTDNDGKPIAFSSQFAVEGETAATVAVRLEASSPGTWGNHISVNVWDADDDSFVKEQHPGQEPIILKRKPIAANNPRNSVKVYVGATGQTRVLKIVTAAPETGEVQIAADTGALTFFAGEAPVAGDEVYVSYVVPKANSRKVRLSFDGQIEVYTVADGDHLAEQLNDPGTPSAFAKGIVQGLNPSELPKKHTRDDDFREFGKPTPPNQAGSDGPDASEADYRTGLAALLNEPVHIVVAAGMDNETIADDLKAHCDTASSDDWKRDRIAVVGSKVDAELNDLRGHTVNSARVIFVAPGIMATDATNGKEVKLPGSYLASVIAGMLSAYPPHVSLTNRSVPVGTLAVKFDPVQLKMLVQTRVLAVEERRGLGIRIVQGLTTDPGAFRQITTRRIVDYAKYGVRSAAEPYIGLLNNERVRGALRATVNSFLAEMVDDEMLVRYKLDVTATRDEERKGICRVTMTLQPTFSIDYIKVTMYLE